MKTKEFNTTITFPKDFKPTKTIIIEDTETKEKASYVREDVVVEMASEAFRKHTAKVKKAKKAIKMILNSFPEEALKDQMNEDYDKVLKIYNSL